MLAISLRDSDALMFTCCPSPRCSALQQYDQICVGFSCVGNYCSLCSQGRLNCLPAFGPSSFSSCPRVWSSLLWMRRLIDVPQSQRLIRTKCELCVGCSCVVMTLVAAHYHSVSNSVTLESWQPSDWDATSAQNCFFNQNWQEKFQVFSAWNDHKFTSWFIRGFNPLESVKSFLQISFSTSLEFICHRKSCTVKIRFWLILKIFCQDCKQQIKALKNPKEMKRKWITWQSGVEEFYRIDLFFSGNLKTLFYFPCS